MDYEQKRMEALSRLGPEGQIRLLETHAGARFLKGRTGANISFHLDDGDDNPSGSLCPDKGLINDFRFGGRRIESCFANGDWKEGIRILFREANMPLSNSSQTKKALESIDFDRLVEQSPISNEVITRADAIFARLKTDCVDYLLSASDDLPIVRYLVETRGIARMTATNRGIGLVPRDRLSQLIADLVNISYPTDQLESFCRHGGYSNYLIWMPTYEGKPTSIKVRGLTKPGAKKNPKNTWIATIRPGEQGYLGSIGAGRAYVFEGEFNLLQADQQVGAPINGLAVGSTSAGKALATHLHKLSKDLTVIGDTDVPGREMVQAIADVKPIKTVFLPDDEDADEYLKHSSWDSLLALSKTALASWIGFREKLKPMIMQKPDENLKDRSTRLIVEALQQKGRILRTSRGECLYIED